MNRWKRILLIFSCLSISTLVMASEAIERAWLAELLTGRDLSSLSSDYAAALADQSGSFEPRRVSPLVELASSEQALVIQVRLLLSAQDSWLDDQSARQQAYLQIAKDRFESASHSIDAWLAGFEDHVEAQSMAAQLKARSVGLKTLIDKPLAGLTPLNKTLLKGLLPKVSKALPDEAAGSLILVPPILRNGALPYDQLQQGAPALDLETDIIPSYHDQYASVPMAEDLAEVSSQEILALAAELDHDYIRIYNFVRQQVKLQFYSGAMKGPEGTLQSMAGNDVDQASLLIALLRASKVAARYVHGVIERPVATLADAMGVDSADLVMQGLNRAGIAYQPVIQGGSVAAIRYQHTWVSAYIPYAHYRGSANDLSDPVWLPLAAAAKTHQLVSSSDDYQVLEINGQGLVEDYLSDSNITVSPLQYWYNTVTQSEQQHNVTITPLEVLDNTSYLDLIPASLPFKVINTQAESAVLSSDHYQQLTIELDDQSDQLLSVVLPVSDVAGKRLTLSYLPATVDDLNVINQAGGMSLVPPAWVSLRPVLRLDGEVIAAGTGTIGMAKMHDLTITFNAPGVQQNMQRSLPAGTYLALALTTQDDDYPVSNVDADLSDDEPVAPRLLHNLAVNYQKQWQQAEKTLAGRMQLSLIRPLPGLVLVSPEYQLAYAGDLPVSMQVAGVSLDAISRTADVLHADDQLRADWMRMAALQGSWLEADIFQSQWQVNAISADQLLRSAENVVSLTPENLAAQLPLLSISDQSKTHIESWVSQGYHALVASSSQSWDDWQGEGWHIWDPQSGASGYFISGGYAGGQTTEGMAQWISEALSSILASPYSEGVNEDALSGSRIRLIEQTNHQFGVVDQLLDLPSQVLVTDQMGRAVKGALVHFTVITSDAKIDTGDQLVTGLDVYTNDQGVAEIEVKLPAHIDHGPLALLSPDDVNKTQLGLVEISVNVLTHQGVLSADRHFYHYAMPGTPAHIYVNDCNWVDGVCTRYSGQQNRYAGRTHVVVTDGFDNVVSNVPITVSGLAAVEPNKSGDQLVQQQGLHHQGKKVMFSAPLSTGQMGSIYPAELNKEASKNHNKVSSSCDQPSPARLAVGSCLVDAPWNVPGCATSTAQLISDHSWVPFASYNGVGQSGTEFPIALSVASLDDVIISRFNGFEFSPGVYSPSGYLLTGDDHNGPNGEFFGAASGGALSGELTPVYYGYDQTDQGCTFTEHRIAEFNQRTTESLAGDGEISLDEGIDPWLFAIQLGEITGKNRHQIVATDLIFETIGDYAGESYASLAAIIPSYTVSSALVDRFPTELIVNDGSYLMQSHRFTFELDQHVDYQAQSISALFYENDQVIERFDVKYPTSNTLDAYLSAGHLIDAEADYFVQLVFNEGTALEFAHDLQPIEGLQRRLVREVSCTDSVEMTSASGCGGPVINNVVASPVSLSTSVDLANADVCRVEGFNLELNTESKVTIEAIQHDVDGNPTGDITTLVDNETLPAGTNLIEAQADQLGNHQYTLIINAQATDNGDQQQVLGHLVSRYDIDNALPIGHSVVKGIDLADGSMVYSKADIKLVSPGADLEFTRTYSSQGRHTLGSLGYGWSHNYLSRVTVTACGQAIVSGGDGGAARFQIQVDEQGTHFVPLKGYHSSLVLNDDGSFDFYPKGGMRYHYIKMQDSVWWMRYSEDPNGNRLTVNLSPRAGAPVISSVTDSVGRSLVFDYQFHDFGIYRSEMLKSVTGPEGLKIDFAYDQLGNLISAKREGDSTDEVMNYSGDQSGPSRSLLLSLTDQARSSTRSWIYNEQAINPSGLNIPTIASIEVGSVSETDSGITTFNYTPGNGYHAAASVNQNGQVTSYTLNDYGAATEILSPAGTRTFNWQTDTDVLLISETDENNRLTTMSYDNHGNLIEEHLGALVRSYTYAPADQFDPPYIKDRLLTMTNWRGDQTTYEYDLQGNKTTQSLGGISESYDYGSKGLLSHHTDGLGLITSYSYDNYGHIHSIHNPENETTTYQYNARGQKIAETDGNGITTTYLYDHSDRVIEKKTALSSWQTSYQQGGRVRTETDPNNHSTIHEYDAAGRLVKVTNALGDEMTAIYDLNGNKTSETDFNGQTTSYQYNDANRLMTKTEPLGKTTSYSYDDVGNLLTETTDDRTTSYTYDPNRYFQVSLTRHSNDGDVITTREVDGHGNILSETDPGGNLTTYTYDAHDRLISESAPLGSGRLLAYDENGNLITETRFNSTGQQITSHSYDLANRISQTTQPEGGIITYHYDQQGNLLSETRPNGYQANYSYNHLNLPLSKYINEQHWTLSYDLAGNLITETGPHGQVITNSYDALNRLISQSDVIGPISTTSYDANGNITSQSDGLATTTIHSYNALNQRTSTTVPLNDDQTRQTSYTYTLFGELLTETGPNGTITHTVDQLGRRRTSSGPDNYSMVYTFDSNGNLTTETDSRGITTTIEYNALNQKTSTTRAGFNQAFSYDTVGNLLSHTDHRGIVAEYSYDKENRSIESKRAGVKQSGTTYNQAGLPVVEQDANGHNTVHQYNNQYYKTRTIRPENHITEYTPNAYGETIHQNNPGPNDITNVYDQRRRLMSQTNGAGEQTHYEYDFNNNRTAVVKPGGQRWEYDYDLGNRPISIRNVDQDIETQYSYDESDNLISITDAESKVTQFAYDQRNRKVAKTYPDDQMVSYGYDENGNLTTVNNPNGTNVTFAYDQLDRQITQSYSGSLGEASVSLTLDGNGNVVEVEETIGGEVYAASMDYDDWDRLILVTDRHDYSLQYTYDNNGNRTVLNDSQNTQSSYSFDKLNRLAQMVVAGTGTFAYSYNQAGLLEHIEYPKGESLFNYDDASRIDLITHKQLGVPVATFDYSYDANGNRIQLNRSNINNDEMITYGYDAADRLTQVTYPEISVTYILDQVGNRQTETIDDGNTPVIRTFGYNNRDQLTSVIDTTGLDISYQYDAAGNQTQKTANGIVTDFSYSPRGRIIGISQDGNTTEYQYDYLGNRVGKEHNGQTSLYTYDGSSLLFETNTIGNTLAKYHYGADRILAESRAGNDYFIFHDALKTPIVISNSDGSIQNRKDYDVWGIQTDQTATDDHPFGFTGYQQDEDTELYYAKARYYDAFTGRFLREDPFEGDFNAPPSLHKYLYAHANPTYHTDPSGTCSIKIYRCQMQMMENENNAEEIDRLLSIRDQMMADRVGDPTTLAYILGATSFLGESVVETGKFAADFLGNALGHDGSERRFSDRVGQTVDFLTNNPWQTAQAALTDELYEIHLLEQAGNQTKANYLKGRLGAAFASPFAGQRLMPGKKSGARRIEEGVDNHVVLHSLSDNQTRGPGKVASDNKFFTNIAQYQSPAGRGTGQNYIVYQQNIDWNLEYKGKTNLVRGLEGGTPYLMKNGKIAQLNLHHSRQDARGSLFEVSNVVHRTKKDNGGKALHPYGNKQHPEHPVDRDAFEVDRKQYWIERAQQAVEVYK